jgi:hypothetical protein
LTLRFTSISVSFVLLLTATKAVGQTAEHVTAVKAAYRAAYAITQSVNRCPAATANLFGWPKERLRYCEYVVRDTALGHDRKAVTWLLDVQPERVAQWIENVCTKVLPANATCFGIVLRSGRNNSGYMFAISGNVVEDMKIKGVFKNYFFRNGMTASVKRGVNDEGEELSLDAQISLAMTADEGILSIPSGRTRFWSTLPNEFASRFPTAGAPSDVATKERRTKWLSLVRQEMLNAVDSSSNRLLEAWLCSNLQVLGRNFRCSAPQSSVG